LAPPAINQPFSPVGPADKTKVLLLDSSDVPPEWMNWARSLHIEHVSPDSLLNREISRTPRSNQGADAATLAMLRRWFFARKPDAGFILTGFPATLLQAKVFDEWLEARDETLDGVFAFPGAPEAIAAHYSTLGLLQSP
jgi:adenylate kinase